jgi:hypothetical protein
VDAGEPEVAVEPVQRAGRSVPVGVVLRAGLVSPPAVDLADVEAVVRPVALDVHEDVELAALGLVEGELLGER